MLSTESLKPIITNATLLGEGLLTAPLCWVRVS